MYFSDLPNDFSDVTTLIFFLKKMYKEIKSKVKKFIKLSKRGLNQAYDDSGVNCKMIYEYFVHKIVSNKYNSRIFSLINSIDSNFVKHVLSFENEDLNFVLALITLNF